MHRLQDSRTDRPVSLPAVGRLLNEPAYAELVTVYGHHRVVEAIREQIATERDGVADGSARHAAVAARLQAGVAPNLRRVINATDVIRLSGARMVEVGTTNRTRTADYEEAVSPRTAAFLRVHTSNFRVTGFTETAPADKLHNAARRHGVLLLEDLGSGAVEQIGDEPSVTESLKYSDVVTFSGDKLLGGPQAGVVLGRSEKGREAVKKMARHPMARAVRIDKLTLAALEATLRQRLTGHADQVPVERMLRAPAEDLRRRAAMWSVKLAERGVETRLVEGSSAVGGGSLPGHHLATVLLAIAGPASRLSTALRKGNPPVIARIEKDECCLDPRTVLRGEDETLLDAVEAAFATLRK